MNDIRAGKIKAEMQAAALKCKLEAQRGHGSPVNIKQETDLDLDSKVKKAMSFLFAVLGVKREREAATSSLEARIEAPKKMRFGTGFASRSSSSWNSRALRHDPWFARGPHRTSGTFPTQLTD